MKPKIIENIIYLPDNVTIFHCLPPYHIAPDGTKMAARTARRSAQKWRLTTAPPPYANVKRRVSVALVYCRATSGRSLLSAVVSMRLDVTALYAALCSAPAKVSTLAACI